MVCAPVSSMVVSVISSSRRVGSSPAVQGLQIVSTSPASRNCSGERLTAMRDMLGPACRLQARLLHHPFADRADQSRFLGNGDELARRQQTALGVTPAQQRLRAENPPVGRGRRSVDIPARTPGAATLARVRLARPPLLQALVHFRVVKPPAATPVGFRTVEREIGGFHQRAGIAAILRRPGNADADADPHQLAVELIRARNAFDDARRRPRRFPRCRRT